MNKEAIKKVANKWIDGKGYSLADIPKLLEDFAIYLRKEWLFEQEQAHQELRGEGESELQKVMDELAEWSDKTFIGQRNPAMLYHLRKEVDEAIEETKNYQNRIVKIEPLGYSSMKLYLEYADMFMLLLDSARVHGFNAKNIIVAIREKLKINKKRKWGKPDKNGVIEHIQHPQTDNK